MSYSQTDTMTHRQLIELVVGSEYEVYISSFSPVHVPWADEAVARRLYDPSYGCGLDGCQIQNDELYMFLSTYQAPRNYVLDSTQLNINDLRADAINSPPRANELLLFENAVGRILNPPTGDNWTAGVLASQPYGWGTRVDVPNAEVDDLWQRLTYCNPEGFAYRLAGIPSDGLQDIFFGVTTQTQGAIISTPLGDVTCSFRP